MLDLSCFMVLYHSHIIIIITGNAGATSRKSYYLDQIDTKEHFVGVLVHLLYIGLRIM